MLLHGDEIRLEIQGFNGGIIAGGIKRGCRELGGKSIANLPRNHRLPLLITETDEDIPLVDLIGLHSHNPVIESLDADTLDDALLKTDGRGGALGGVVERPRTRLGRHRAFLEGAHVIGNVEARDLGESYGLSANLYTVIINR